MRLNLEKGDFDTDWRSATRMTQSDRSGEFSAPERRRLRGMQG
jgi:hypothetical protein